MTTTNKSGFPSGDIASRTALAIEGFFEERPECDGVPMYVKLSHNPDDDILEFALDMPYHARAGDAWCIVNTLVDFGERAMRGAIRINESTGILSLLFFNTIIIDAYAAFSYTDLNLMPFDADDELHEDSERVFTTRNGTLQTLRGHRAASISFERKKDGTYYPSFMQDWCIDPTGATGANNSRDGFAAKLLDHAVAAFKEAVSDASGECRGDAAIARALAAA